MFVNMKRILYLIIITISLSCCNYAPDKPKREVLKETQDYKILGTLNNGLLTDSLLYYRHDTLFVKQYWDKGSLVSTEYYDNGEPHLIEYITLKIDSNTWANSYQDANDKNYQVYPYDINLIAFYDSIAVLSSTKFEKDKPTTFTFLNIPKNGYSAMSTKSIITYDISNNTYTVTPKGEKGDTITIAAHYMLWGMFDNPPKNLMGSFKDRKLVGKKFIIN